MDFELKENKILKTSSTDNILFSISFIIFLFKSLLIIFDIFFFSLLKVNNELKSNKYFVYSKLELYKALGNKKYLEFLFDIFTNGWKYFL